MAKGRSGAEALDDVGAQMEITGTAMPRLAKEIGDYSTKKMDALTKEGNLEEAAKWAEGGIYRVAAHTTLGAMGGGLGGVVGAAGVAKAAPTIDKFQDVMEAKLTEAGLSDGSANLAAKLLSSGIAAGVGSVAGGAGAVAGLNADANNRQLHQREYDFARKYAKLVANKLGISTEAAEGRIAAEILRNSDKQTADLAQGKHDYEVRSLLGCQNLNCAGEAKDPNYGDHNYNREYIATNLTTYHAGRSQKAGGQTYDELVTSNIKNDPVGAVTAGAGMIAFGYIAGGASGSVGLKLIGGGFGASANYTFQPAGQKDWIDISLAGFTGFLTTGASFNGSMAINVGGSIVGSGIKGENPNPGIAASVVGTGAGYAAGKLLEIPLAKTIYSRSFMSPDWIDLGNGISRWNAPSVVPGVAGGVSSSFAQEPVGNFVKEKMQGNKK